MMNGQSISLYDFEALSRLRLRIVQISIRKEDITALIIDEMTNISVCVKAPAASPLVTE